MSNYPRACPIGGCDRDNFETPQALGKHLRSAHHTNIAAVEGRPPRVSRPRRRANFDPQLVAGPAVGRPLKGVETVDAIRCDGCRKLEEYDPGAFTWSRITVQTPLHGDIVLLFHSPACQKANFNRRFDERMRAIADAG